MGIRSKANLNVLVGLSQIVLICCCVASSGIVCPEKCTCKPFGSKRFVVKCKGITQVPRGLPLNTARLILSQNYLSSIDEDSFRGLTILKEIDLSNNVLTSIQRDTFRNLTFLEIINLDENSIEGGFHLPESVRHITMRENRLSSDDLKTIVSKSKRVNYLDISGNPIGPNLTADLFSDLKEMRFLYIANCSLKNIQSGTFGGMKNLLSLDLGLNMLSSMQPGTLEGPADKLITLILSENSLLSIADGTFGRLSNLNEFVVQKNQLGSVPDFTGVTAFSHLSLKYNQIKDISRLGNSSLKHVFDLNLRDNQIEHLAAEVFQKLPVSHFLDLSFNKLQSLPDEAFSSCNSLTALLLNFNYISNISRRTFAGLTNLQILMIIHNNLTYIRNNTFADTPLKVLFLHSNAIKHLDGMAFGGLRNLKSLTLFSNPFELLPVTLFDEMAPNTTLAISCKNLKQLSPGRYTAFIDCTPSTSFHVILYDEQLSYRHSLVHSGFTCGKCNPKQVISYRCENCTFCMAGTYSDVDNYCLPCSPGGFYQDEMGQVTCKRCSIGTYVSENRHPGKSPTDCYACPYGTLSNETAGYRACRCLHGFYRVDRFGPCSACPAHGINCVNDTAILAPGYYWKWPSQTKRELYKHFFESIQVGYGYNKSFSKFQDPLPKPLKCPYAGSCNGGIDSACQFRYKGTLCATCSNNHYLRFNTCLECPRMLVTIISCTVVVLVFVAVFLVVLWGDSRCTENNRTVADVVMSCCKIVIGFYQVIAGIFSALERVQWPVTLLSMENYLKFVEGNILQFAPLSCIQSQLRPDPFLQFILAIGTNILVVSLILLYLFLKKRCINKMEIFMSEKILKISSLKKSCYRNIFLFLLLSYPITSKKIIHILPLPGACVNICFSQDNSDCISLLKADYSIHCFTARHNVFWKIAGLFAVYPLAFPLVLLLPIYKYRQSENDIAFGFRVFYENYKTKYWFWEILEMYRKLILISIILLFGSEGRSQIGLTLVTASASGITYTIFRPIKGKFEDRLQAFVLWIIFFNVCLGAIYSEPDVSGNHTENDSVLVNVLFVLLNCSVLIFAVAKGIVYVRSTWRTVSFCPKRCFHLIWRGCCNCCRRGNRALPMENVPHWLRGEELDLVY